MAAISNNDRHDMGAANNGVFFASERRTNMGKDATICLVARLVGEFKPADISLAAGVDLEALKKDDNDPMEVVVEVPAGKSTRGWDYTGEALQQIVTHVNQHTLSGFLGHQKPEDVGSQFPTPVTHWVGAVWRDNKAYFRGVVDKVAGDLKRWIRAKRVKQVSIFGAPVLKTANGETKVVGYKPMSIDWTPLDRAGMPTRLVAVGEIDSTFGAGELDGSIEDLQKAIRQALYAKYPGYDTYIERLFPERVIAVVNKGGYTRKMLAIPYSVSGDAVALGDAVEVELEIVRNYVPVTGELDGSFDDIMNAVEAAVRAKFSQVTTFGGRSENVYAYLRRLFPDKAIIETGTGTGRKMLLVPYKIDESGSVVFGQATEVEEKREYVPVVAGEQTGGIAMTLQEMLAAIRSALAKGEAKFPDVLGEIGVTKEQAIEALAGEQLRTAQAGADLGKKLCTALGFGADMKTAEAVAVAGEMSGVWKTLGFDKAKPEKPAEVVGAMVRVQAENGKAAHAKLVSDTINEKVTGEQAQALVTKMLRVPENATKEQIGGEIDNLLKDDAVKGFLGKAFIDKPAGTAGTGGQEPARQHTRVKRVGI